MKFKLNWRNFRNVSLALVAMILFLANIPQAAHYQGDALIQTRVHKVVTTTEDLNTFLLELGIEPQRLNARTDWNGDMNKWHVVLQSTTTYREYVKTSDWDEVQWTDAAGNPHYDRSGGYRIIEVRNLTAGRINNNWIEWKPDYTDYQITAGYSREPLGAFKARLRRDFKTRDELVTTPDTAGLDGQGRALIKALGRMDPRVPGRNNGLVKMINSFFRRHRTPLIFYTARTTQDGQYIYIRARDKATGDIAHGYLIEDRQVIKWRGNPAPSREEGWVQFFARIVSESGCSVANPDTMIAIVGGTNEDIIRIDDMIKQATYGQNLYTYVDRFTPSNFRWLFGTSAGPNDPWTHGYLSSPPAYTSEPFGLDPSGQGDCHDHYAVLWDYHLLWVASDTASQRDTYQLTRYEADTLAAWLSDGGTIILGSQNDNVKESWFPTCSYGQVYPISGWFEFENTWTDHYSQEGYMTTSNPSYIGKGLRWDIPNGFNPFGAYHSFFNEPINTHFYPIFKMYYRTDLDDVEVKLTVIDLDGAWKTASWDYEDHYLVLRFYLPNTDGEWSMFSVDVREAATDENNFDSLAPISSDVMEPGEVVQLVRVEIEYEGTGTGYQDRFFEVDEMSCTTGGEELREAYLDAYGRGASYGFGDDFEVCRWTDLVGEDGYRRWDASIEDGSAAFHVYAAEPPGAPAITGPFPEATESMWWEIDRGANWIQYLNVTNPAQKKCEVGYDMVNLGTVGEPIWVSSGEYRGQYVIQTVNDTQLVFDDMAGFMDYVTNYPSNIWGIGIQTTSAVAGFALNPDRAYTLGQMVYAPRLQDRTLPTLGTAQYHIMPRLLAKIGDNWYQRSLARINKDHWATGVDPRLSISAYRNETGGWMEISYTTYHASVLSSEWSYTLIIRVYDYDPIPHLKIKLECHSHDLADLGVAYDVLSTGWRSGHDLDRVVSGDNQYSVDVLHDITDVNTILRLVSQNNAGFLLDFADMRDSGFTNPRLRVLDIDAPWGGTQRVVQIGMMHHDPVPANSTVTIDPVLQPTTVAMDDVYAWYDDTEAWGGSETGDVTVGVDTFTEMVQDQIPVYPVADSYVYSYSPNSNYGTAGSLYSEYYNPWGTDREKHVYLRFNLLSNLPAGAVITSATLMLKIEGVRNYGRDYVRAYEVSDNTWSETGITWNNKPAMQGELDVEGGGGVGTWDEFIMDSWAQARFQAGEDVSVGLRSDYCFYPRQEGLNYYSRETSGEDSDPYLLVAYEVPVTHYRANRILTRFDITPITSQIQPQQIDSATLRCIINDAGGTDPISAIYLQRTTNWNWDSSTHQQRWEWGNLDPTFIPYYLLPEWMEYDVTDSVQAVYNDGDDYAAWKLWFADDANLNYELWMQHASTYPFNTIYTSSYLEITYSNFNTAPTIYDTQILNLDNDGTGPPGFGDGGNWNYRKAHTITGSPDGLLEDYAVHLNVHRWTGDPASIPSDSGEDVYIHDTKIRSDFADLRFTKANDDALDYWIEFISGDDASVWVEIDSILQGSDVAIYILYGNNDATCDSDMGATMLFADDFSDPATVGTDDGVSLTGSGTLWNWERPDQTAGSESFSVTNGELHINAESTDHSHGFTFTAPGTYSGNLAIYVKARWENYDYYRGGGTWAPGAYFKDPVTEQVTGMGVGLRGDYRIQLRRYIEGVLVQQNPSDYATGTYILDMTYYGGTWSLDLGGTYDSNSVDGSGSGSCTGLIFNIATLIDRWSTQSPISVETYFDLVFIRQYTANEPTHSTWGAEESGGGSTPDRCYAGRTYTVITTVEDFNSHHPGGNGGTDIALVTVTIGDDVLVLESHVTPMPPPADPIVWFGIASGYTNYPFTYTFLDEHTIKFEWTYSPSWGTTLLDADIQVDVTEIDTGWVGWGPYTYTETEVDYAHLICELQLTDYTVIGDTHVNPQEDVTFTGTLYYSDGRPFDSVWTGLSVSIADTEEIAMIVGGTVTDGSFSETGEMYTIVDEYSMILAVGHDYSDGLYFTGQSIGVTIDKLVLEWGSGTTDTTDWWVDSDSSFIWEVKCKYEYSETYIDGFEIMWNGQTYTEGSANDVDGQLDGVLTLPAESNYILEKDFTALPLNDHVDGIITGDNLDCTVVWTHIMYSIVSDDYFLNVSRYPGWEEGYTENELNDLYPFMLQTGIPLLTVTAWWAHDSSVYVGSLILLADGNPVLYPEAGTLYILDGTKTHQLEFSIDPTIRVYSCINHQNDYGITMIEVSVFNPEIMWDFDSDNDELVNYEETQLHATDPDNPDTDQDGLGDFYEIMYLFNPGFFTNFTHRDYESFWTAYGDGVWEILDLDGTDIGDAPALRVTSGLEAVQWCLLDSYSWKDLTVSLGVMMPTDGSFGVFYYFQDSSNYYYLQITRNDGEPDSFLKVWLISSGSWQELGSVTIPTASLVPDESHFLHISVMGEEHHISFTDPAFAIWVLDLEEQSTFTEGAFAYAVEQGTGSVGFSNTTVGGLDDWYLDTDSDGIPNWVEYNITSSPKDNTDPPGGVWGVFVSDSFSISSTTFNTLEFSASGSDNCLVRIILGSWTTGWFGIGDESHLYRFILDSGLAISDITIEVRSLDGLLSIVSFEWIQIYEWDTTRNGPIIPRDLEWDATALQNEEFRYMSKGGALIGTIPNWIPNGRDGYGIDVRARIPDWWAQQMWANGPSPAIASSSLVTFLSDATTTVDQFNVLDAGDEWGVYPIDSRDLEYPVMGRELYMASYPYMSMTLDTNDINDAPPELVTPFSDATTVYSGDYPFFQDLPTFPTMNGTSQGRVGNAPPYGVVTSLYMLETKTTYRELGAPVKHYAYYPFWGVDSGSYGELPNIENIVVEQGDVLEYLIHVPTPDPEVWIHAAGVDIEFEYPDYTHTYMCKGRSISSMADIVDQNEVPGYPMADIAPYAGTDWYYRKIEIPDTFAGLEYETIHLVDAGSGYPPITTLHPGQYTTNLGYCRILRHDGTVKIDAYSGNEALEGWTGVAQDDPLYGGDEFFTEFSGGICGGTPCRTPYWYWFELTPDYQTKMCLRWTGTINTPASTPTSGQLGFWHVDVTDVVDASDPGYTVTTTWKDALDGNDVTFVAFDSAGCPVDVVKGIDVTMVEGETVGAYQQTWEQQSGSEVTFPGWNDAGYGYATCYLYVEEETEIDAVIFQIDVNGYDTGQLGPRDSENYDQLSWGVEVVLNGEALDNLTMTQDQDGDGVLDRNDADYHYEYGHYGSDPLKLTPGFNSLVIYIGLEDITDKQWILDSLATGTFSHQWTLRDVQFAEIVDWSTQNVIAKEFMTTLDDPYQLLDNYLAVQLPAPKANGDLFATRAGHVFIHGFVEGDDYTASGNPTDKWEGLYGLSSDGTGFAQEVGGYHLCAGTLFAENVIRMMADVYDPYLMETEGNVAKWVQSGDYPVVANPTVPETYPDATTTEVIEQYWKQVTGTLISRDSDEQRVAFAWDIDPGYSITGSLTDTWSKTDGNVVVMEATGGVPAPIFYFQLDNQPGSKVDYLDINLCGYVSIYVQGIVHAYNFETETWTQMMPIAIHNEMGEWSYRIGEALWDDAEDYVSDTNQIKIAVFPNTGYFYLDYISVDVEYGRHQFMDAFNTMAEMWDFEDMKDFIKTVYGWPSVGEATTGRMWGNFLATNILNVWYGDINNDYISVWFQYCEFNPTNAQYPPASSWDYIEWYRVYDDLYVERVQDTTAWGPPPYWIYSNPFYDEDVPENNIISVVQMFDELQQTRQDWEDQSMGSWENLPARTLSEMMGAIDPLKAVIQTAADVFVNPIIEQMFWESYATLASIFYPDATDDEIAGYLAMVQSDDMGTAASSGDYNFKIMQSGMNRAGGGIKYGGHQMGWYWAQRQLFNWLATQTRRSVLLRYVVDANLLASTFFTSTYGHHNIHQILNFDASMELSTQFQLRLVNNGQHDCAKVGSAPPYPTVQLMSSQYELVTLIPPDGKVHEAATVPVLTFMLPTDIADSESPVAKRLQMFMDIAGGSEDYLLDPSEPRDEQKEIDGQPNPDYNPALTLDILGVKVTADGDAYTLSTPNARFTSTSTTDIYSQCTSDQQDWIDQKAEALTTPLLKFKRNADGTFQILGAQIGKGLYSDNGEMYTDTLEKLLDNKAEMLPGTFVDFTQLSAEQKCGNEAVDSSGCMRVVIDVPSSKVDATQNPDNHHKFAMITIVPKDAKHAAAMFKATIARQLKVIQQYYEALTNPKLKQMLEGEWKDVGTTEDAITQLRKELRSFCENAMGSLALLAIIVDPDIAQFVVQRKTTGVSEGATTDGFTKPKPCPVPDQVTGSPASSIVEAYHRLRKATNRLGGADGWGIDNLLNPRGSPNQLMKLLKTIETAFQVAEKFIDSSPHDATLHMNLHMAAVTITSKLFAKLRDNGYGVLDNILGLSMIQTLFKSQGAKMELLKQLFPKGVPKISCSRDPMQMKHKSQEQSPLTILGIWGTEIDEVSYYLTALASALNNDITGGALGASSVWPGAVFGNKVEGEQALAELSAFLHSIQALAQMVRIAPHLEIPASSGEGSITLLEYLQETLPLQDLRDFIEAQTGESLPINHVGLTRAMFPGEYKFLTEQATLNGDPVSVAHLLYSGNMKSAKGVLKIDNFPAKSEAAYSASSYTTAAKTALFRGQIKSRKWQADTFSKQGPQNAFRLKIAGKSVSPGFYTLVMLTGGRGKLMNAIFSKSGYKGPTLAEIQAFMQTEITVNGVKVKREQLTTVSASGVLRAITIPGRRMKAGSDSFKDGQQTSYSTVRVCSDGTRANVPITLPSTVLEDLPGILGHYPKANDLSVWAQYGQFLEQIREKVGYNPEQAMADGYHELLQILKRHAGKGNGLNRLAGEALFELIEWVAVNAEAMGFAGDHPGALFDQDALLTREELFDLARTKPKDPRVVAFFEMAKVVGTQLNIPDSLLGKMPYGGLEYIDPGRRELVPYGDDLDPDTPANEPSAVNQYNQLSYEEAMAYYGDPSMTPLYEQTHLCPITSFRQGVMGGLKNQLISKNPFQSAFAYQLIWGPLGMVVGQALVYLGLHMKVEGINANELNTDFPGGIFWWAFDPIDGKQDPWWFLPFTHALWTEDVDGNPFTVDLIPPYDPAIIDLDSDNDGNDDFPYPAGFPHELGGSNTATEEHWRRMHEVHYDEMYKWTWVIGLSLAVWVTDYIDLGGDGIAMISGAKDFGMEFVNCILSGVQVGIAQVFQSSCIATSSSTETGTQFPTYYGWDDTLQLDEEWDDADREPPYFWLNGEAKWRGGAPVNGVDLDYKEGQTGIPVIPSYLLPLESAPSVVRHMLCYSPVQITPDGAGGNRVFRIPEWEPTLGVWICGLGLDFLADDSPLAHVWEFFWWANMMAAGAVLSYYAGGGATSLAKCFGSVIASQVANIVASGVINLAMKGLSTILVGQILSGLPTWDYSASTRRDTTSSSSHIGNPRPIQYVYPS